MERDNSTQFLMNSVIGLTEEQLGERRQYSSCVCSHQVYEWKRKDKGRKTLGPEGSVAPSAQEELRAFWRKGGREGGEAGRQRGIRPLRPRGQRQLLLPFGLLAVLLQKLPEKNRSPATCPVHLGAGVSSRVPTQFKPIGAEDWTESIFRVQFCRVAFKDLSSPRAHTPSPGRVPVRQ